MAEVRSTDEESKSAESTVLEDPDFRRGHRRRVYPRRAFVTIPMVYLEDEALIQHAAVFALIVGNLASMAAIAVSVVTWRRLRVQFLLFFIRFQVLVFLAEMVELVRVYVFANLAVDGSVVRALFTLGIAVPTVWGLWCLIRCIGEILSEPLILETVVFFVPAVVLVSAELAISAELMQVAEWVVAGAQILLVGVLCSLGVRMIVSPGTLSRSAAWAVRLGGAWLVAKVLSDYGALGGLAIGLADFATVVVLRSASETAAAILVIIYIQNFASAVSGGARAAAPVVEINPEYVLQYSITSREQEIVALIMEGLTNQQVADRLHISPATVKDHVYRIYQKTGVSNRVQLVNLFR